MAQFFSCQNLFNGCFRMLCSEVRPYHLMSFSGLDMNMSQSLNHHFAFRCLIIPYHQIFMSSKYQKSDIQTFPICFQNTHIEKTALFSHSALHLTVDHTQIVQILADNSRSWASDQNRTYFKIKPQFEGHTVANGHSII